jgi:hypothetical protein
MDRIDEIREHVKAARSRDSIPIKDAWEYLVFCEYLLSEVERLAKRAADQEEMYQHALAMFNSEHIRAEKAEQMQRENYCKFARQQERAEKAETERDAATEDMEALMWHSGDGCTICANAIKDTRVDYSKYDCKLGSTIRCKPKWRGLQEAKRERGICGTTNLPCSGREPVCEHERGQEDGKEKQT